MVATTAPLAAPPTLPGTVLMPRFVPGAKYGKLQHLYSGTAWLIFVKPGRQWRQGRMVDFAAQVHGQQSLSFGCPKTIAMHCLLYMQLYMLSTGVRFPSDALLFAVRVCTAVHSLIFCVLKRCSGMHVLGFASVFETFCKFVFARLQSI